MIRQWHTRTSERVREERRSAREKRRHVRNEGGAIKVIHEEGVE